MTIQTIFTKPIFAGLIWGIIGGIALIVVTFLTTSGFAQITPYFVILTTAILTIKYSNKSNIKFVSLFICGLFTFVLMSFILYLYIIKIENPNSQISLLGHLWRFGVILGMGIASSSIISFIAKPVK